MVWRRGVGVVGLLGEEITVIAVGDRHRHGGVMLIRVFRGRIF